MLKVAHTHMLSHTFYQGGFGGCVIFNLFNITTDTLQIEVVTEEVGEAVDMCGVVETF